MNDAHSSGGDIAACGSDGMLLAACTPSDTTSSVPNSHNDIPSTEIRYGVVLPPNKRLAVVPEHECAVSDYSEGTSVLPLTGYGHADSRKTPFFRGQRKDIIDFVSAQSGHVDTGSVACPPGKPSPALPECITGNRELGLTKAQLLSNRRHLEGPVVKLVEEAVKPFLAEKDCELVSKAVAEMMVHVDQAETAESLVDVLARRLPVLERIGAHWQSMAKV